MLAAAAVLVTAAAAVPAASAHAQLVSTDPGDGAVLARAPARVTLVFDDDVHVQRGTTVVGNAGKRRVAGKPQSSGRTVVIPLRKLGDGDYTVRWRVLSNDGHTVQGVFAFGVGSGRAAPKPVLAAGGGLGAATLISRWLFFAGVLVAAGVALFMPLVWGPARRAAGVEQDGAGPLWGLVFTGCLLAFLGASGLVPHHAAATTRFSVFIEVAGVLAAIGATLAAIAFADRRVGWLAFAAAVLLVPMPSLAGHALDRGQWRPLNVIADTLHIGAAALWIGGLLALAIAAPRLSRALTEEQRRRFTGTLVPRLSAVALGSVAVIAATGLVRALSELSAVSQLWSTGYGRALLVKTALLLGVVGLGWANRNRLVPRIAAPGAGAALRRNVSVELVLLAGVVVGVAFLTDLAPGRQVGRALAKAAPAERRPIAPPPHGAAVFAAELGDRALGLAVLPDGRLQATVLDPDRRGVDGLDVARCPPRRAAQAATGRRRASPAARLGCSSAGAASLASICRRPPCRRRRWYSERVLPIWRCEASSSGSASRRARATTSRRRGASLRPTASRTCRRAAPARSSSAAGAGTATAADRGSPRPRLRSRCREHGGGRSRSTRVRSDGRRSGARARGS